ASAPRARTASAACCLGPSAPCAANAASTPRSHARGEPDRLAASAPCAANTLPRPHAGRPPQLLGRQHSMLPRPHAQPAPRPRARLDPSVPRAPRPLGPMLSSSADGANLPPRPHAGRPPQLLGRQHSLLPRPHARPARLAYVVLLGFLLPRHTCVVCPPASCYSIARCPRPHQRGLSAYVVLLGRSMPKATPARPARLRRATRSHDARDHTC
ncbi:unnamed protein product, partial [Musa hybrid cultivar]